MLTTQQIIDAVEMYRHGQSVVEIGKAFDRDRATILKYLRSAGVVLKRRNSLDQPVDVVEATMLYKCGATLAEIAGRYGCSWMTVQRRLVSAGVEMHAPGCRYINPQTPSETRLSANERARNRRSAISSRHHDGLARGLSWRDIAKRDHMRCQICGCKVDPNDKWKSDSGRWCFGRYYPTIDHIVALHNGGTDTYDNVQLACKHCNSKKGHKGQTRLVI